MHTQTYERGSKSQSSLFVVVGFRVGGEGGGGREMVE